MSSRVNPSAMSRHDVRRQLFGSSAHSRSSRLNPMTGTTAPSASTASINGHSNSSSSTETLGPGAEANNGPSLRAPGASTASAAGGAYRSHGGYGYGIGFPHHGGASTAAATSHGTRSSHIPTTKSRSRTVRGRAQQEGGVLDDASSQGSARGYAGENSSMSGSKWDDISSPAYLHNLRRKAQPSLMPEEPEDVVLRDSNGSYGEALEVPLQMMMLLRPELLREQEEEKRANECEVEYTHKGITNQIPSLLAQVNQALRAKVQSLQNDNWMLEDDMKDRVYRN